MFPLGHAAVAYLCYAGYTVGRQQSLPTRIALVPLAIGSQLPDVIDKPLAFYQILSSGRSFGHSIIIGVALLGVFTWGVSRFTHPDSKWQRLLQYTPAAIGIGYLTHLLGDVVGIVLSGRLTEARFLLWPLFPPIDYTGDTISPFVRLLRVYQQPSTHPQLELILLAGVVFVVSELLEHRK